MPRNSSGVYSKPAGTTAVAGNLIDPVPWNSLTTDLGNEITNSLPRDGSAPMTAPFLASAGTSLLPSITFNTAATTGFYLKSATEIGVISAAVEVGTIGPYGFNLGAFASKSGNYTAVVADNNAVHRYTATATVSLTAAATLGSNWRYTAVADGATVTIDPNGAETINGAATLVLQSGQTASIICTGSAFIALVEGTVITGPGQQGYLYGLTLSNNGSDATHDIDIAVGIAAADTSPYYLMQLTSGLTKRLDAAWAVGTGNGGLDTGSIANTTYHIWLIQRSDTGVVDALFSTSATSPTMPTNFDRKCLIGSIVRVSNAIKAFKQDKDRVVWASGVSDVVANNPGASAVTRSLSLPTGRSLIAILQLQFFINAATTPTTYFLVSDPALPDNTPSLANHSLSASLTGVLSDGLALIQTNTSAQVRSRVDVSGTTVNIAITTIGYIDPLGRK